MAIHFVRLYYLLFFIFCCFFIQPEIANGSHLEDLLCTNVNKFAKNVSAKCSCSLAQCVGVPLGSWEGISSCSFLISGCRKFEIGF